MAKIIYIRNFFCVTCSFEIVEHAPEWDGGGKFYYCPDCAGNPTMEEELYEEIQCEVCNAVNRLEE